MVQELVPGIAYFALTRRIGRCCRHRKRKKDPSAYFHRCEKAVESRPAYSMFSGFGILPAPELPRLAPVAPRAARPGLRPLTAATRQRGIVADCLGRGKRKVCEGSPLRSHLVHSFSTSTNIVQLSFDLHISQVISLNCGHRSPAKHES